MAGFDLDAARAARAEKLEERFFTFHGEQFKLPGEMPFSAVVAASDGDIEEIMRELLGEKSYERFKSLGPSASDVNDLVEWLMPEYGLGDASQNGAAGEPDPKSQPS